MSGVDPAAETDGAVLYRRLLIGAVALALVVLLGASAATMALVANSEEATGWVNHTYQVQTLLADMRVALSRTEAARRGYLITRDAFYLSTYHQAANDLPSLAERFQSLTSDNPRQQAAYQRLEPLLRRKLEEQSRSLQAMNADGRTTIDPAALVREDQGTLTRLRDELAGMRAEEGRLLALRTRTQAHDARDLLAVVLASSVMLALLSVGAFVLMRRYAADLDRSQAALRRLNVGLEEEVRRRTADLVRANEEIQRFAYIVSHDLRSPLVNVMGFTSELETAAKFLSELITRLKKEAPQLLSRGATEAVEVDLPESIGFIRSSTQKMDRLINAILRLSREGRRNLTAEPIAMGALMDSVFASLRQQAESRGATLEVEGVLPDLVNDRLAVEQVFSNVVENALKYLKPGRAGVIRVRGRVEGATRTFEVQDNGRGIDPKDHERVFELFRRAGAQDQPGEGIGLAHVRALVYRLGGVITVDSELDRGATFRICLPRALSAAEERQ